MPPAECAALLLDMARADGLETFTAIWNELPLRDDAIAALLQTLPQKVINLRKSARERLAKRMRALEELA